MQQLRYIFWLIRPINLAFIALTAYAVRFWLLTPFFNRFFLKFETSPSEFVILVLSYVCIAGGGNAINDYFDNKADLLNKPKKSIVNVHLDRRYAMWTHQILSGAGFVLAAYYAIITDNLLLLSFHGFAIVSLWYYSYEFKTRLFIGNLVVATLTAFVPFSTGLFELLPVLRNQSKHLNEFMELQGSSGQFLITIILTWLVCVSGFAFFSNFIREIVKDLQDQKGDKAIGRATIPLIWGQKKAKILVQILSVCLLGSLWIIAEYLIGNSFTNTYFVLAFTLPILLIIILVQKNNFTWASNIIKLVMLLGIVYLYFIEKEFF